MHNIRNSIFIIIMEALEINGSDLEIRPKK